MLFILAGILVFALLIGVHELGHFLAAKACGVGVHEFAIGMGPALWQKQGKKTLYSLRLLPFGGYCAIEGEEEDSDSPTALNNQSLPRRVLIFAAGAAMNFIAGVLILLALYAGAKGFYTAEVIHIDPQSPLGQQGGLQLGDILWEIDGERVYTKNNVSLLLGLNRDGTYDFTVRRDGQLVEIRDFAMERSQYLDTEGKPYTGFGFSVGGVEEATFLSKLRYTWYTAMDFVRSVRISLTMLVQGDAGIQDLSGPVGLVNMMGQAGQQGATVWEGLENIGYLAALIAVNLAVMNLLPLPALDGGKIFFALVNGLSFLLFKKTIPPKWENYVHAAGLILLLGLMVVVLFQDVWRLIG